MKDEDSLTHEELTHEASLTKTRAVSLTNAHRLTQSLTHFAANSRSRKVPCLTHED